MLQQREADVLEVSNIIEEEEGGTTSNIVTTALLQYRNTNLSSFLITPSKLQSCAKLITKRYPILHSHFQKSTTETYTLKLKSDLIEVVDAEIRIRKDEDEDFWKRLANDLIVHFAFDQFGAKKPLWRVIAVLPETTTIPPVSFQLILVMDHAISDGLSAFRILHDLFKYLVMDESALPKLEDVETLPLHDAPRKLLFPNGHTEQDKAIIDKEVREDEEEAQQQMYIPHEITSSSASTSSNTTATTTVSSAAAAAATEDVEETRRENRLLFFCINKESFAELKKFCKSQQVTVGVYTFACLCFATAKLVSELQSTTTEAATSTAAAPLQMIIDINLRDRLEPKLTSEAVGLLISFFDMHVHLAAEKTWGDVLQEIKLTAHELIQEQKSYRYWLDALEKILKVEGGYLPEGRYTDLEVSNIGAYPYNHEVDSQLTIEHLFTASGFMPVGPTFAVIFSSVVTMDFVVIYEKTVTRKETAERFAKLLQWTLEHGYTLNPSTTVQQFTMSTVE